MNKDDDHTVFQTEEDKEKLEKEIFGDQSDDITDTDITVNDL